MAYFPWVYPTVIEAPPPPDVEIITTSLPNADRGVAYRASVEAAGGTPPFTFTLLSGSFPTGLSMSADGDITGTPTVAGTFLPVVRVTDTQNEVDSGVLPIIVDNVAALEITTGATLSQGEVGEAYTRTLATTGGWGTVTWAVTAGTLPTGLSLSTAGVLSGTPTTAGITTFTITATDSEARQDSQLFSLTVVEAGTIEGAHDYFEEWRTHETIHRAQSLRVSAAELQALQQNTSLGGSPWTYNPAGDTHPEAQDACKLSVERVNSAGNPVWSIVGGHQLYMRLSPPIATPDKVLYSWDWYWCREFVDNRGGVYAYKTWQTRPTPSAGWWTHMTWMLIANGNLHFADACRSGSQPPNNPAGVIDAGDDRFVPLGEGVTYSQVRYNNAYQLKVSTWTRYWVEIKLACDPSEFTSWNATYGVTVGANPAANSNGKWHMLSMWIADETRDVERVLYQMPMGWASYLGSSWTPQMSVFSFEMNTSKTGATGPMYGYGRQFLAFKNYDLAAVPEEDPIFQKPVR